MSSSDQDSRKPGASDGSSPGMLKKSLLEHFWDEVEEAHGDNLQTVNPFTEERSLRVLEVEAVDVTALSRIPRCNIDPASQISSYSIGSKS